MLILNALSFVAVCVCIQKDVNWIINATNLRTLNETFGSGSLGHTNNSVISNTIPKKKTPKLQLQPNTQCGCESTKRYTHWFLYGAYKSKFMLSC